MFCSVYKKYEETYKKIGVPEIPEPKISHFLLLEYYFLIVCLVLNIYFLP